LVVVVNVADGFLVVVVLVLVLVTSAAEVVGTMEVSDGVCEDGCDGIDVWIVKDIDSVLVVGSILIVVSVLVVVYSKLLVLRTREEWSTVLVTVTVLELT
jgi:hypothetical protein